VKTPTARTILATWVAISVLVGTTLAFLIWTNLPSEQLYESVIDDRDVGAAAIAFFKWSLLTFVCGAPITWAVMARRTRVVARRLRHEPAEEHPSEPMNARHETDELLDRS
jgi:hypothetical protein